MQSATECQALCTASSSCQMYEAVVTRDRPSTVSCTFKSYNPSSINGYGSFTGVKGRCSDLANSYTLPQQQACYDSPTMMYASARARARRSPKPAPFSPFCHQHETSCPVKRHDGTYGSGFECVDVRSLIKLK